METINYYIIWLEEVDARKEEAWECFFVAVFCLSAAVVCIRWECRWKDFTECSFNDIVFLHPLIEGIVKNGIKIIG